MPLHKISNAPCSSFDIYVYSLLIFDQFDQFDSALRHSFMQINFTIKYYSKTIILTYIKIFTTKPQNDQICLPKIYDGVL